MKFIFLETAHRLEIRRLVKKLVPPVFILAIAYVRHRRRFPGRFISAGSKIAAGAVIGQNCSIHESVIGATTTIGDFSTINHQCRFGGKGTISVGKFCSIAPDCLFWSENHDAAMPSTFPLEHFLTGKTERWMEYPAAPITIGNNVWVGQRAIILAGAAIGDGCVVAAGSVVPRGTYPPFSLIGGAPARAIRPRLATDRVEELTALRWWDQPPETVFGPLMEKLHQK